MIATVAAPFVFMGAAHVAVLIGTAVVAAGLVRVSRRAGSAALTRRIAVVIAAILLITEAASYVQGFRSGGWPRLIRNDLPLHICGCAIYLTALALLTRRQLVFEVAFYWGIIGTVQALLTPNVTEGPCGVWFWLFFIRHSLIVVGVIFAWLAMDMRPRRHSAWWVFGITNVWLAIVACANWWLGSNYMFLCQAPDVASPLVKPPWPWYVVIADLLLIVGFCGLQWLSRRPRRS